MINEVNENNFIEKCEEAKKEIQEFYFQFGEETKFIDTFPVNKHIGKFLLDYMDIFIKDWQDKILNSAHEKNLKGSIYKGPEGIPNKKLERLIRDICMFYYNKVFENVRKIDRKNYIGYGQELIRKIA